MRTVKQPHALFDYLRETYRLSDDVELAVFLGVTTPCISKIRHGTNVVSANVIIKIHEATGISIKDIKAYLVDHG